MKLLLLLVLIGLSLHAPVKSDAPPEDLALERVDNSSAPIPPALVRQNRAAHGLRWVSGGRYVPSYAVGIYNSHARRYEYVCKYGCHFGFFSYSYGPYCNVPLGGEERKYSSFQFLVNQYNYVYLQWKRGSYGRVPANSVGWCSGMYVGKNRYGLGKVDVKNTAFFLARNGNEDWFKHYDVLTRRYW